MNSTRDAQVSTPQTAPFPLLWSLEVPPRAAAGLEDVVGVLPPRTPIYIAAPAGVDVEVLGRAILDVHGHGFQPVPHIAARRIGSRSALVDMLRAAVTDAGVRQVLLIGGDEAVPAGPYRDSVAVLADGVLAECGITQVGLAAFPEGHPHLMAGAVRSVLEKKIRLLRAQGQSAYALTQFSFAPERVLAYCAELARVFPDLPVHVGIAGPTDPVRLLRYAQLCGVNAGRRALAQLGFGIAKLAVHTDPVAQVTRVRRYISQRVDANITGIHVFGFGGPRHSAEWIAGVCH